MKEIGKTKEGDFLVTLSPSEHREFYRLMIPNLASGAIIDGRIPDICISSGATDGIGYMGPGIYSGAVKVVK